MPPVLSSLALKFRVLLNETQSQSKIVIDTPKFIENDVLRHFGSHPFVLMVLSSTPMKTVLSTPEVFFPRGNLA